MGEKVIYFSGLNGLRAICALAVVISHTTLGLGEFGLDAKIFGTFEDGSAKGLDLAGYGVTIFFVLSGFLITYLLQEEIEKDGSVSIKKFYMRRILRIWPLYYLYLGLSIAFVFLFSIPAEFNSLWYYLLFSANVPFIIGGLFPFVGHYWSLGVEEQFYMFWPWFVKKVKNVEILLLVIIVTLIALRVGLHFVKPNTLLESVLHIVRFHAMMIGALGAILYRKNNVLFLKLIDNKITQLICWSILILLGLNKFHLASIIDGDIVAVVGLCLIVGQINIKNRIINLENKIFNYLGKISFGIYVIHPLLIFLFGKILSQIQVDITLKYIIVYFSIVITTIIVSYLSYEYFEKFFLKLKNRFVVVHSKSSNT